MAACRRRLAASISRPLPRQCAWQEWKSEWASSLLNRSTRKISLTTEGEIYLQHATRLIDELREMDEIVSGDCRNPTVTMHDVILYFQHSVRIIELLDIVVQ